MLLAITNLVFVGIGLWGVNVPIAWGVDILNFVWWIGIGHAGTLILRDSSPAAPEMANIDQPLCGGDDALRSRPGWHVSDIPPWSTVVGVLAVPLSKHDGNLAAVSQPADVGRVCGFDLRDRVG